MKIKNMRAHYKNFLCLAMTIFFLGFAMPSHAQEQESLFTVTDVTVDVTARSSAVAREKAFSDAQKIAFQTLSERMLSEHAVKGFVSPGPSVISSLIHDFEITNEKLSAVRYVGTYTFRFKDKPVRNFFAGIGVSYTDVTSRPVLILPFYQVGEETVIWSPYNSWLRAWRNAGDQVGVVPMVVPIGDIADVQDVSDNEALSYDPARLQRMIRRYGAGESVLTIAVPDSSLLAVEKLEDPAFGYLSIYIYRTDEAGPEFVQRLTLAADSGETKEELFLKAATSVQKILRDNWKNRTTVDPDAANVLPVRVRFQSFPQWIQTQKILEDVYGVDEVQLKNLSSKDAYLDLVFQGSERRLRLALQQAGLTLSKPRINIASLQAGAEAAPLVYELYLSQ